MATVDPIELGVFAQLLPSIAEEVGVVLQRAAASPNIKERRDYSAAVFDRDGRLLAQAAHIPVHLGSAAIGVRAAIAARPMRAGDAVVVNDPYAGGTHLPDITIVTPVVAAKRLAPLYYVATRAHHADVGGAAPGSMVSVPEIYQEGLRLPPVYLMRDDRFNADVVDVLLANVRTPDERRADLDAQVAANRRGVARMHELLARYGRARVDRVAAALLDHASRAVGNAIADLPDGTYAFEDALDDDGFGGGPYPIRVRLRIRGRRATVDFTGTHPQVPGSVNANRAITTAAVFYAFRCLLDDDTPTNEGVLAPIDIVTEPSTLVDARPPAAVAGGNVETSQRIVDVVLGALAGAAPDRIPAASQGTMNNVTLGGRHPADDRPIAYYETLPGGAGATPNADGTPAIQTHMTNTRNTPAEALEHELPVEVESTAIRRRSGGRGRQRGGDGLVRRIRLRARLAIGLLTERRQGAPYGLDGGEPGARGRNRLIRDGRTQTLPAKGTVAGDVDDVLSIETPGGGGYGKRPR